jgi:hypothetical protein
VVFVAEAWLEVVPLHRPSDFAVASLTTQRNASHGEPMWPTTTVPSPLIAATEEVVVPDGSGTH